ncbi:MAG TPA: hypothetical protein VF469_37970 [Kofleriaceae bacterium]
MKQLLLILAIGLAPTGDALAQPAESMPAAKLTLARRSYGEGIDAAGAGRWDVAYDRFLESYELVPRMLTLFNLAGAQGETARLVEASESYRRFLRDTGDGRYPELRTDATHQLELLGKQIAQLSLEVVHLEPEDAIAIDDVEFPQVALHEAIPMNPGPHVVLVRRGTVVIATRAVTLASGESNLTHIELRVAMPGPAHRGASSAWLQSPWLWFAVAILGAATASGVYRFTRSPAP